LTYLLSIAVVTPCFCFIHVQLYFQLLVNISPSSMSSSRLGVAEYSSLGSRILANPNSKLENPNYCTKSHPTRSCL